MFDTAAYGVMFASALIAATVFPAQSEAVLVAFLLGGDHSVAMLLLVASVGNILGSVVNYGLGLAAQSLRHKPWFPVSQKALKRARVRYHRYGRWSLLLSWAPIIGDPLTVAAGVLREPFWSFLILVSIAKTGRYIVLTALTLGWISAFAAGS